MAGTEKRRSIQRTQQEFRVHFPSKQQSSSLFLHLQECEEVWGVRDKYKLQSKRAVGQEQQELQLIFSEFGALHTKPKASARKNNVPDIRMSPFHRITRKDLIWHPFKINIRHNLEPNDYAVRIQYNPSEVLLVSRLFHEIE